MNPLFSDICRPGSLKAFYGLPASLRKQLELWVAKQWMPPLILWGNPGSGKTSLARLLAKELKATLIERSAPSTGVKELREIFGQHQGRLQPSLLFIDEIHRLSTAQQDVLLPVLEQGGFFFIGATTENPLHGVNSALRSRTFSIHLKSLNAEALVDLGKKICEQKHISISHEMIEKLALEAHGDARQFLNWIQVTQDGPESFDIISQQSLTRGFNPTSTQRYDYVSAWIKSMRAGNQSQALLYLGTLIKIQEDPKFLARRLMIFAAEDLDGSEHLEAGAAIGRMAESLGYPEIRSPFSKITLAFCNAKKSREAIERIDRVLSYLETHDLPVVPKELRNHFHESEFAHPSDERTS